ncbi:MAG: hypothetical protein BWK79_12960 [Beggiatoa sp. IS2]|nr:MAG: hypothetical protein BWK79_12960 [Beggiatoa sp. IS2]
MVVLKAIVASQAKLDFLAKISHEIRTPMNSILGMTEWLLATEPSAQQHNYGDIIYSLAETLLDIINDILDFSILENWQLYLLDETISPFTAQGKRI